MTSQATTETKQRALPSYPHIIRALNLVRDEADVAELEEELKADPVVSYRLMLHVNSVGMGFPRQIKSYRQAVTVLGFHQLYRWLVTLLVTADPSDRGSAIGRNAIIRGRFMELMGQAHFRDSPPDDFFVVGVFSLLELLFGEPMQVLIGDLRIGEPVRAALVDRQGPYAPLLALAEAIESAEESAIAAAMEILPALPIEAVFEAYEKALTWAEAIDAPGNTH